LNTESDVLNDNDVISKIENVNDVLYEEEKNLLNKQKLQNEELQKVQNNEEVVLIQKHKRELKNIDIDDIERVIKIQQEEELNLKEDHEKQDISLKEIQSDEIKRINDSKLGTNELDNTDEIVPIDTDTVDIIDDLLPMEDEEINQPEDKKQNNIINNEVEQSDNILDKQFDILLMEDENIKIKNKLDVMNNKQNDVVPDIVEVSDDVSEEILEEEEGSCDAYKYAVKKIVKPFDQKNIWNSHFSSCGEW